MTDTPAQDDVLLYPEAAELLRVSERTLRRWVTDGIVPCLRTAGSVRFSRAALLKLVENGAPAGSEAG